MFNCSGHAKQPKQSNLMASHRLTQAAGQLGHQQAVYFALSHALYRQQYCVSLSTHYTYRSIYDIPFKLSLVQLQQLPLSWEGFLQDFKVSVEMFARSSRRAFLRSDTNVGHSQSLFSFIPTVSDGVEIRALCGSIKFFHTKLIQHFLFGPCLKTPKIHGQLKH